MTDDADPTGGTHRAIEATARESYGRLVAWLASRCGDLQLAEDAVGEALEAALRVWPERGVPDRPEAWLLTTARRKVIDRQRRNQTASEQGQAYREHAARLQIEAQEAADSPFVDGLPERRLELMLLCVHPDIEPGMRTPLMLQTVLGLNAERIGSAMLVKPATMGQRLSRLKRRIKDDGLSFEVPSPDELPTRVGYLLDAIYAAYGAGWETASTGLAEEAIWLARLLVALVPDYAEPKGLLALMLHAEARRGARRDEDGNYIPLEAQDTERWDHPRIAEAESVLRLAARQRQAGPYQFEAAIQSLHAHRARTGETNWVGVHKLYRELSRRYPGLGASVGLAASCGRVGEPAQGLALLETIDEALVLHHQPYWAVRAHLLVQEGRRDEARLAYDRAIGLTEDPSVRRWLVSQRDE